MRHIGVTASREGLSFDQKHEAEKMLAEFEVLHHGDCVHGDEALHKIGRKLGLRVIVHPPASIVMRAFCEGDEVRTALPYIVRNHAIVNESERLIAFPKTEGQEEPYSGTWATIRYARKVNKPVAIVFPSGNINFERWEALAQPQGAGEGK